MMTETGSEGQLAFEIYKHFEWMVSVGYTASPHVLLAHFDKRTRFAPDFAALGIDNPERFLFAVANDLCEEIMMANTPPPRSRYELGDTAVYRTKYHGLVPVTLVSAMELAAGHCHYDWYSPQTATVYGVHHTTVQDHVRPTDPLVRQANWQEAEAHYRAVLSQYPVWQTRFAANPAYPIFRSPLSTMRDRPFTFGWRVE
jgi:hypothetical protein